MKGSDSIILTRSIDHQSVSNYQFPFVALGWLNFCRNSINHDSNGGKRFINSEFNHLQNLKAKNFKIKKPPFSINLSSRNDRWLFWGEIRKHWLETKEKVLFFSKKIFVSCVMSWIFNKWAFWKFIIRGGDKQPPKMMVCVAEHFQPRMPFSQSGAWGIIDR